MAVKNLYSLGLLRNGKVYPSKQVAIQGLDGYIVAERDGRLLICKLADEQRIKEFSK